MPAFEPTWVLYADLAGFREELRRDPTRLASTYGTITRTFDRHGCEQTIAAALEKCSTGELTIPSTELPKSIRDLRQVRIFSDSVFVFIRAAPDEQLRWAIPQLLLESALFLSINLWANSLAFRGAFAYGNCVVEPNDSIFLGDPIVNAYNWEQAQEWFGISVEPRSLKIADEIGLTALLSYTHVFTKTGRARVPCVRFPGLGSPWGETPDPTAGFLAAYNRAVEQGTISAIPKYINTAAVISQIGTCTYAIASLAAAVP
jgi:hypothetical protein